MQDIKGQNYFTTLKGFGSVMDVWPLGDYSQFIPNADRSSMISVYWSNLHGYFDAALNKHAQLKSQNGNGLQ
ncbi:hypothetical protein LGV61_12445 [Desulfurispirillum indicum]|uniref:hypothetical protein n=1 Tax=Desulfurispirillum indicum TaxID=936456 RepID=UPI001CF95FAD|nr:hypothetical protein [Desulfurispirillum indicum]UCZ56521.1 hypothetical protein LGV61_12445 [Desulfurispirillum indicum]